MKKLFISYNHKDQLFVNAVKEKLIKFGYTDHHQIFYDESSLIAGEDWIKKIQEAISSSVMIVFIGSHGIGRFQQKEVLAAVNEQIKNGRTSTIIPVIIEQERSELSKEIPWFLADYQWVGFNSAEDNFALDKLLKGIRNTNPRIFLLDKNPYKGLNYFEEDDSEFFFGRQFDVNWVFYKKLKLGSKDFSKNFLIIIGSSGSGKSSFVRAGLLAAIKNGKYKDSNNWLRIIMNPGQKPMTNLSAILENMGVIKDAYNFNKEAATDKNRLYLAAEIYQNTFVLVIDQLEEVISLCSDEAERASFLNNISEAKRSNKIIILATLRTDFYSRFSKYKIFADLMEESNYTLEDIELPAGIHTDQVKDEDIERKLTDIITKPASICGITTGTGLVQKLVEETRGINGPLPVLQMALSKLWKQELRKKKNEILSSDFDQLSGGKGLDGVIEKHADDVFDEFTDDGTNYTKTSLVKHIFIRLVELTENREDVRKSLTKTELIGQLSNIFSAKEVENAIIFLSGSEARLLRVKKVKDLISETGFKDESNIEVVHEVLIRKWGKLVNWINERRGAIQYRNFLVKHITKDKSRRKYYSGFELSEAKLWLKENKDLADMSIKSFIKKSKERSNIKLATITLLTIGLIIGMWLIYDRFNWFVFKESSLAKRYTISNINLTKSIELNDSSDFKFLHYYMNCDSLTISVFPTSQVFDEIKHQLFKIKYLKINNPEKVTLDFSFLDYATSLEEISINGCEIENLDFLKNAKDIHKLELSFSNLKTLRGLENIDKINCLILSNLDSLTNFNALFKINKIDTLYLKAMSFKDLSILKEINGLNSIYLIDNDSLNNVKGLTDLNTLTNVSISNYNVGSNLKDNASLKLIDFSHWNSNTKLQALSIAGLLTLKEIKGLNTLTNLKALYFANLDSLNSISIEELNNLNRLKELTLGTAFTTLSGIERFKDLEYISLIFNKQFLTQSLPYLKLLKKIRKIRLDIVDTSLNWELVSGLHQADTVEITCHKPEYFFNQYGFESLKKIKYLSVVFGSSLNLMDINKLVDLKSIKELSFEGTPLTREEEIRIKKELINCKIKFDKG